MSKETFLKKKLILERMSSGLKDLTAKENLKIQRNKINLSNKEKREKQKAIYAESLILTEEKRIQLDSYFEPMNQEKDPIEKVKFVANFLDSSFLKNSELSGIFQLYVFEICPDFRTIMKLFSKHRKETFEEQERKVLEEFLKMN
jgi:hypothetical protein